MNTDRILRKRRQPRILDPQEFVSCFAQAYGAIETAEKTVPFLRDPDQISRLTRHSASGFVPGYDYSVPAALDFAILVPPPSP